MLSKLNFSEFLEFFCRVAHMSFYRSEMEELSLAVKVGNLMDEVFEECLNGAERTLIPEICYESESDNDY
jgi:hypothetical protein